MKSIFRCRPFALAWLVLALAGCAAGSPPAVDAGDERLQRIGQIVVIYMENRSFDHVLGMLPGVDGIAGQGQASQQGPDGKAYAQLPPVRFDSGEIDPRFSAPLPNAPFRLDPTVSLQEKTGSPVHAFWTHARQINGGRNDRFVVEGNTGALPMGYFDGNSTHLAALARRFTVADRFFQSAYGGSFLNHFWLVCACSPVFKDAPAAIVARDERGSTDVAGEEARVTRDGFAVNTLQGPWLRDPTKHHALLPPQDSPTIGDRLSAKGIGWTYYADGYDEAVANTVAGRKTAHFSYHHQPFAYFKRFIDNPAQRAAHLKDRTDMLRDIAAGALPPVSFYKPRGGKNMHPGMGNSSIGAGDDDLAAITTAIMAGPQWKDTLVVITFDENGGFWDHVAPPKGDRFGPATRIPAVLVSPFTEGGHVDHTEYETVSILKLIQQRFKLAPLSERDARANSLAGALRN